MKKGVVFTILSIVIAWLIIMMYVWNYTTPVDVEVEAKTLRASYINAYLTGLDEYLSIITRHGTRTTLNDMALYVNETGNYLNNVNEAFKECFLIGKINGNDCEHHRNATFKHWIKKFVNFSKEQVGVNVSIEVSNASITQEYPFFTTTSIYATIRVSDPVVYFKYKKKYKVLVPIENLRDPTYLKNNRKEQIIKISPHEEDHQWGVDSLEEMYKNHEYRSMLNVSPSYLMRFEGNFSKSYCCGIETLINTTLVNPPKNNRSYTDYQIYKDSRFKCGEEAYSINGFSDSDFMLDRKHLKLYDIPGVLWSNSTC